MKILYYYSKLKIGGAERSTIRLLNELAKQGHQVTLLLRWNGELEHELHSSIECIHLKKSIPVFKRLGKVGAALNHGFGFISLLYKKNWILPQKRYDLAMNGLLGYDPQILFDKVHAKCYMQMLRNDVSLTRSYGKTEHYMSIYGRKFQAYIGVSQYVTNSFQECYPDLAKRAHTIYNILPDIDVEKERRCPAVYAKNRDVLRILTVCRLEEKSKGLLRMANVAKKLKQEFKGKFQWYVVGDGQDKELLEAKIAEYHLEDTMILCGASNDPMPYYAHADLVAVLSYYEGLCGVVNEAKIMRRPVIATRFSGIDEQLVTEMNGIIVENEENQILDGMREILKNPDGIQKYQINGMPEKLLNNKGKVLDLVNLYTTLSNVDLKEG